MTDMLEKDLILRRVIRSDGRFPFICSPLGFVPKPRGKLRRIYHLLYPCTQSTNDGIQQEYRYLQYARVFDVCNTILLAGRGAWIIKRDQELAFRTILISEQDRWLMGFQWRDQFYTECCLPFGLRTAPFLFNLFGEALHQILQSWLGWSLVTHYLDDIIYVILDSKRHLIQSKAEEYINLTNLLRVPQNDEKDRLGQVEEVFGYKLDTLLFEIRIPQKKLKAIQDLIKTFQKRKSMTLHDVQEIAGYLSQASPAVQLGQVFYRKIQDFQTYFTGKRHHIQL